MRLQYKKMENETDNPPRVIAHESSQKILYAKQLRGQMTESEKILWKKLRANRFCNAHFRRQTVIRGFVVDFFCVDAGLIIELDGSVHEKQEEYDKEREEVLAGLGLRVIRFTNEQIKFELQKALDTIADKLDNRS
jgi:very-short-patch-repair endonuclease